MDLSRALEDRIAAFDSTCLRRILRIPYTAHATTAEVRLRAGSPPQLLPLIQTRRLRFFGPSHGWAIRKTRPEPYIRRFAGYPRTVGAAQDVHVAPGYGPWKQTSSRSITVWTQPGDSLRTEDDGSNSWKRLRSSQWHARDDDDAVVQSAVQQTARKIYNKSKANSKSTTSPQQVACNNQQVLQQVAQLVVQQIRS